jgi:hypothetical protein
MHHISTKEDQMSRVTATELDYRESGWIEVSLLWDRESDELIVAVRDKATDEGFEITVENNTHALDVFHHPYEYAPGSALPSPSQKWERDSGHAPTRLLGL